MNKFILSGRVGLVKAEEGDNAKATFSLAVDDSYKDQKSGEWQSRTNWFYVVTFNPKLVGMVNKAVAVGDLLEVEGELDPWSKDTDNGKISGINLKLGQFKRLHRPNTEAGTGE